MASSSSRPCVDPELLPALESFPPFELSEAVLPALRSMPPILAVAEGDVQRSELTRRTVPGAGDAPSVEVLVYRPSQVSGLLPCVLHMHGGGYVVGSAAANEAAHRPLVADLRCCLVSVEYRLAPETRFPGAVEDCYAALRWIVDRAEEIGVDPLRIGVMGESAGGGLAAALALLARDRGEFHLAFQHLIYPMIDDRTCLLPDPRPAVGEFVWTPERNRFGWASLLGGPPGGGEVSAYAAAARARDLQGLPPTFIAAGALDLFLGENLDYARRLSLGGVPVELHVYPGAFHGFQMARRATVTKRADRDSREALARALAARPTAAA